MILPESSVFCLNKYLLSQRDWVSARSYPHHHQKLFPTDTPNSSWPIFFFFFYLIMNFQQKTLWSTKEEPFVMNSQNNSLIHQKALSSAVINSRIAALLFLSLIFISLMSSAPSDSQGRAIASCITSSLFALANPLISKLLSCSQSNIFVLALDLQMNR